MPLRRVRQHRGGGRGGGALKPFRFEQATDAGAAVATLLREEGAMFLAGGTNLVDLMKLGVAVPELLVDVNGLLDDAVEELPDGGLRIGAGVRNSDLAAHAVVRDRYAVLSEALLSGASGQLRNQATVGGNLLQRTRCRYFQDVTKPCNKRNPGTGCSAREGVDQRSLAILGASRACVATHPSDMAVALAVLDAVVHVYGRDGERAIALADFYRLPGEEPERDTTLESAELITAVELPPLQARSRYRKARDRASFSFALASVAALVDDEGTRIAFGGVAHAPWRATRAEAALRDGAGFAEAAEAELAAAAPLPGNAFKVPLLRNLLVRTLEELA